MMVRRIDLTERVRLYRPAPQTLEEKITRTLEDSGLVTIHRHHLLDVVQELLKVMQEPVQVTVTLESGQVRSVTSDRPVKLLSVNYDGVDRREWLNEAGDPQWAQVKLHESGPQPSGQEVEITRRYFRQWDT